MIRTRKNGAERSTLKLALVGCGAIAEFAYLPACRQVMDAQVVALADTDVSRARRLAQIYGIATCVEDYHQLPQDIDGVIIALPHDLHAPVASEFLRRHTAVLVEKPLALTSAEAERVVELARTN